VRLLSAGIAAKLARSASGGRHGRFARFAFAVGAKEMQNPAATIPATLLLAQAPMSANAIVVATKERTGFADEIGAAIAATAYHSRAKGDILVASLPAFCLEYYHFRLVGYSPIVLESALMHFAVYRNA
jgi:hypothetical protein